MEVAAPEEATMGTWADLDAFAAALQLCARSLGESRADVWLLGMLAGGGKEAVSSWSSWWSEMLGRCLKGWECSWRVCEGVLVVELCFGASGQGGGAVEVGGGWVPLGFSAMVGG